MDSNVITAVQVALATQAAFRALDAASVKVLAFKQYVHLSNTAHSARKALAYLLDRQSSELALTGYGHQGQQLFLMPSAKESGCWQLTRFDSQGEPWGDTHFTNRLLGLEQYLRDVDLRSISSQDGPFGDHKITADAQAALLLNTQAVGNDGLPLTLYHGTQNVFTTFAHNPRGLFFTEDRDAAVPFSRIRKGEPVIKAVHLVINRPWTMIRYSDDTPYSVQVDQSIATLKAKGFDGIHCPDDRVWIAFDPGQVFDAAAIDNISEDDGTSDDLTQAETPHV